MKSEKVTLRFNVIGDKKRRIREFLSYEDLGKFLFENSERIKIYDIKRG